MKARKILFFVVAVVFLALGVSTPPISAHDENHPEDTQEILGGQLADVGWLNEITYPDYATNCSSYLRPVTSQWKTSAIATCYNYSGSGSVYYQIAALAFDGCNRYIWFYGNVGWVYARGITTNGKQSFVYTPPGKWYFVSKKVVVWKP